MGEGVGSRFQRHLPQGYGQPLPDVDLDRLIPVEIAALGVFDFDPQAERTGPGHHRFDEKVDVDMTGGVAARRIDPGPDPEGGDIRGQVPGDVPLGIKGLPQENFGLFPGADGDVAVACLAGGVPAAPHGLDPVAVIDEVVPAPELAKRQVKGGGLGKAVRNGVDIRMFDTPGVRILMAGVVQRHQEAPGVNGGLAAPKHPEIPRHQVGAVASLPSHGQVVLQGHRVLPVPARQAARLPR